MDKKELENIAEAQTSFKEFINRVFSKSFDNFIGGQYPNDIANFMQYHHEHSNNTIRISARLHGKSTFIYAYIMWLIFRMDKELSIIYFSYSSKMSSYHVTKIKKLISSNPYFKELIDLKPTAETLMAYKWKNSDYEATVNPQGLLGFKRGLHCDCVIIDDPYSIDKEVTNEVINFSNVAKINNIIKAQVLDIPYVDGGEIHIVGTPFSNDDVFFDKELRKIFAFWEAPAIKDEKNKIALWPEYMDWDNLMMRKATRSNFFAREYLCQPIIASEGYLTREQILDVVDNSLTNNDIYDIITIPANTIAGFDIGKKRHPSAISVLRWDGISYKEIYNRFLDNWDYTNGSEFDPDNPTQLEFLKLVIENFKIDILYFDNTRGEFEAFIETQSLPQQAKPVVFSLKEKTAMAMHLSNAITEKLISIQNNTRSINSLLSVMKDLQSIETPEGHGDMFWAMALACKALYEIHPRKGGAKVSTGSPSVIDGEIPKGW